MKTVTVIHWVSVNRIHNVKSAQQNMFIIILLNGLSYSCIIILSAISFILMYIFDKKHSALFFFTILWIHLHS